MLGFLRSTVEENASVDTADMKPLKKNLGSLGYYHPTEGVDLHDYPDEPLFKGIRKFQKDESLKVDGVMKPGGPTENRLLERMSKSGEKTSGQPTTGRNHPRKPDREAPTPNPSPSAGLRSGRPRKPREPIFYYPFGGIRG
jgi:hypothetical protein